jgi:hypothetical protein
MAAALKTTAICLVTADYRFVLPLLYVVQQSQHPPPQHPPFEQSGQPQSQQDVCPLVPFCAAGKVFESIMVVSY